MGGVPCVRGARVWMKRGEDFAGCVVSPRAAGRLRPPAGSMGGWANSSAVACLQRFNAASTRPPCSQAEAGAVLARPTHALRPTLLSHRFMRTPLAEQEIEAHLSRIFKEREERELAREPSLAQIPRILLRKPPTQAQSSLPQQELGRQARARLREKMSNLVLQHLELEQMWGLLKKHASPPHQPSAFSPLTHASQLGAGPGAARPPHLTPHIPRHTRGASRPTHATRNRHCSLAADERINWDDFSQIAEEMPPRAAESYFSAKHFVLFELDAYGRIPIVHFFQWAMRKNELMRTRRRLSVPSWWWCHSPLRSGSPRAGSPGLLVALRTRDEPPGRSGPYGRAVVRP